MIRKEIRAKEGFESFVNEAKAYIAKLEELKNSEISSIEAKYEEAKKVEIAPIEAKYTSRLSGYERIISDYSEEFEVEIPDEVIQEVFEEPAVEVEVTAEEPTPIE